MSFAYFLQTLLLQMRIHYTVSAMTMQPLRVSVDEFGGIAEQLLEVDGTPLLDEAGLYVFVNQQGRSKCGMAVCESHIQKDSRSVANER